MVQSLSKFHVPTHVIRVVQGKLSKEIVDAKRNFETVLSEVELIGSVKFIDFDGLRDVGVVF